MPTTIQAQLDVSALNESSRPMAPKILGATDAQRQRGGRLAAIHAIHLSDMARVRALSLRIDNDAAARILLAQAVDDLAMFNNIKTFGAMCGRECTNLLFHHQGEEQQIFPALAAHAGTGFRGVLAKLKAEHLVIHEMISDLSDQAGQVMTLPSPKSYAALREALSRLDAALKSHFGYEKTELKEVLGVLHIL